MCSEEVSKCFWEISNVFQECFKGDSRSLNGLENGSKGESKICLGSINGVSIVFQRYFKEVSRRFYGVSKKFQFFSD